jgi:hypothetical protein
MSSMLGLGGAVSWCIAGPIIDQLGWRWLLWVPVLFAAWLVAALTALTQGMEWGWTSPGVIGLLAVAAVLAGVWLAVEARVAQPLVDLRLMRRRAIWTANAASLLSGYALMAGGAAVPAAGPAP